MRTCFIVAEHFRPLILEGKVPFSEMCSYLLVGSTDRYPHILSQFCIIIMTHKAGYDYG